MMIPSFITLANIFLILAACVYIFDLSTAKYFIAAYKLIIQPVAVSCSEHGNVEIDVSLIFLKRILATIIISYMTKQLIRWVKAKYKTPKRPKLIMSTCITQDNYDEVDVPNATMINWRLKLNSRLTKREFLQLNCGCEKLGLKQVAPYITTTDNTPYIEPIIYHICQANNYAAIKRQCARVILPEKQTLKDFESWFDGIFRSEIQPILDSFVYNYDAWYNDLDLKQQQEVNKLDRDHLDLDNAYTMFVKVEKQFYDNGKAPKNRCICSPNATHKYVMGPVVKALDECFRQLKGYCNGKNWEEMETFYNYCDHRGLTKTVQLDGSGFDRTQHQELKNMIDCRIYKHIADKITHVDPKTFLFYATPQKRKIKVQYFDKKNGLSSLGYVEARGQTFSGSADTTFGNTLRMSLYNRYVMEVILGLKPRDYDLVSKGDDVTVFVDPKITDTRIQKAYDIAFYTKKYKPTEEDQYHGLGQIAKYIKIGGISDVDFCSTTTFYAQDIESYKIIRQIHRFFMMTPWSRKALSYTTDELKCYLQGLYIANTLWMHNMPILSVYNKKLEQDMTNVKIVNKMGQSKENVELTDLHSFQNLKLYLDRDFYYSTKDRVSCRQPTRQDYARYFLEKYNLSSDDIAEIEDQIRNSTEYVIQSKQICELLA